MKPSEKAKEAGLSGLKEVSGIAGVSEQTLINWSSNPNKSKLFSALLVGCACLKAGYEIKSGSLYKKVEIPEDDQALEHMPDKTKIKEGEA